MSGNSSKYHFLTALVITLFLIIGLSTLDDYGMGWDEITRWQSGDAKLAYYVNLFSEDPNSAQSRLLGDRYPGLFDLPLSAYHAAFGGNRMIQGHVLSICFGVLGLISTAWLANTLFGARTAFLSTVFLAVFPRFYGHAMINPKDIPFLAAYTLGLAGLFWVAKRILQSGIPQIRYFVACGLFIGLAGSSRIPGLVLFAIAGVVWLACLLWSHWLTTNSKIRMRHLLRLGTGLFLTGCMAFIVVLIFFPRVQSQLFSSIPSVAGTLHTSANNMPLLFNGEIMDAKDAPFAYAIQFFLFATPLWMLGLLAVGLFSLFRSCKHLRSQNNSAAFIRLLFLGAAAFPWCYITLMQPAIHDGLRHVLFAVPPLMIIMAQGVDFIGDQLKSRQPMLGTAATVVLAVLVLMQVRHLIQMHPYQYVSYNLLAGDRETIPNRFDAEYWCTSSKHLLDALPSVVSSERDLPGETDPPIRIRVSGALDSARQFVPKGFVLVDSFEEADYYVSNTNFRIDLIVDGEVVYEIKRGGIPIGVIKRLKPVP
jgi:hypothetical protein